MTGESGIGIKEPINIDGINYAMDWDAVCATYDNFKNLQESVAWFWKTQEEAKADLLKNSKTGFCTIFKKKNNRAVTTFNTIWVFTENHGKVYWIINWILWEIAEKHKEQSHKDLLNFINGKLDEEKDKDLIEFLKGQFETFDSKYRILIGK